MPFLRLFLFLATGIVVGEYAGYNGWAVAVVLSVGVVLMALPYVVRNAADNYRLRGCFGVGAWCVVAAFGLLAHHHFAEKTHIAFAESDGIYAATLVSQPVEKERSVMCRADLRAVVDSTNFVPAKGRVILYFAKDSAALALRRGANLLISTALAQPQLTGNPEEFDYGRYLYRQGIGGTGYVAAGSWQIEGYEEGFSLRALADDCRAYLLDIYRKMGLSGNEFGMLAALTLGYKDALTPELRESFSTTGAMHVLAVSGLHVGIIYAVLGWLLACILPKKRKWSDRLQSLLVILFLWFYAFVTGLSPSVLRATVMFSFMALAGLIGRQSQTYNTIFLSAFLLLLYRPTLLFEVGFQLSYSAVLAIVYFQPKIVALLPVRNRLLRWAWELAAVSLAAQIGTAPFSIFYFHQFPNYFLLSNFVVIPAATLILYAAILLFVVSWIPWVNIGVAFVLKWILRSMYFLITCIEHLPHALSIVWISEWQLLFVYISIFAVGWCCARFSFRSIVAALVAVLAVCLLQIGNHWHALRADEVWIYNQNKVLIVNHIAPSRNLVISTDSAACVRVAADHWQCLEAAAPAFVTDSAGLHAFVAQGKNYLVLTDSKPLRYKTAAQRLEADYLIVGRGVYPDEHLFDLLQPRVLITAGDVYASRDERFAELAAANGCDFRSVRLEGAIAIRRAKDVK